MKVHVEKNKQQMVKDMKSLIESQKGKATLSNLELLKRIEALEKALLAK